MSITLDPSLDTFPKLLAHNGKTYPAETAMREKQFGIWVSFTWADVLARTKALTLGLATLGVTKNSVVGLIGDNRPEWVMGELATHTLGGLSLGIYRDAMEDEVAYLVTYADIDVMLCEDEEQVDKLLALGDRIPSVRHIVYADPRGMRKYEDARLISLQDVLARGNQALASDPTRFDTLVAATETEAVAVLCTTSGTTSHPKLAMLTGGSMVRHARSYLSVDPKGPQDDYVSVLPLPWIMEQMYAVAKWLVCRMVVNFVEEPETMMADMREIGPTFALLAPRVWESIAGDVRAKIMDSSRLKRLLYDFGMKLGQQALADGRRSALADFILFRALRDRLGFTRLRSAATGGAALGPDTFKFFQAMGVPLRQLYGQTETMGAYTIHRAGEVDFDTVGVAFDDTIDIRIDNPDQNGIGEIVTRHPNMFTGYFRNEAASKADIRDGWMHTGDAGYFDKKGHLTVIDRIKDIATTSSGARFSPAYIENKLKFSPYVAEAVILGDHRDYLAAMICIRYPVVSKWAEKNRISFTTYSDLSAKDETYALLHREVMKINEGLPEFQRIRKFLLLYKELDADDGELTRTRKVRRGVVNEKYADIIQAVYGDVAIVPIDTTIVFQDGTKQRIKTSVRVIDLREASGAASGGAHPRAA
ncbi:MAG: long-chain fatty acid--CoA ligase [Elstera sp.]